MQGQARDDELEGVAPSMKVWTLRSVAVFSVGGNSGAGNAASLCIAYPSDRTAPPFLDSGAQVTLLEDWFPRTPGLKL